MKKYAFYINLLFTCLNFPFALQGQVFNIVVTVVCGVATIIAYKESNPFNFKRGV